MKHFTYQDVTLTNGFLAEKEKLNRDVTINAVYDRFSETGRIGAFDFNTDAVHYFWDSDVAKWIEGASYIIAKYPNAELEQKIEHIIDRIEEHQGEDGYFNIWYTVKEPNGRWLKRATHARLVIRLMQDELRGGERVLDVGTGSGILSICASKLGAKWCNAYDIDPVAVKVARDNVESDGCTNITVGVSDLLRGVDLSEGKYDFCVANIVADIIIRMLPDIKDYLLPGSPLILSGIIGERAEEVRNSVVSNGFTVEKEIKENDWIGMLVRV